MADISKIKTIDGTSYDIKDSMGRKEAYLEWGGKNFSASYGCIDAAMVSSLGANRFALLNAAGITVEYTRDGGTTWTDYGLTDFQKTQLFTDTGYTCRVGKSTNVAGNRADPNCLLRVTIDTSLARCYSVLNKFVLYITTGGSSGCYVTIDRATHAAPTTWVNVVDKIGIAGYSGYNVINTSGITTYGNSDSQNQFLRFTFGVGNSATNVGLGIAQIMAFGGVGWNTASTMAKNGHLYTYDASQNATFPAKVTATEGFNLPANKYFESSSNYGLHANNSDLAGLNGLYFGDACDNAGEGINFYRSASAWDSFRANGGKLQFSPNRAKSAAGTWYDIYHAGNKPTYSDVGAAATSHTHAISDVTNLQTTLDGKAASSHNHAASEITSGTLGVARGGTGAATFTSNAVLTGNATSAFKAVATASGALYATAANGAAKFGTLPIAQGGTGKTTAADALAALGGAKAPTVAAITLAKGTWSSKKYSLESSYAKASYDISVEPNGDSCTAAQLEAWNAAKIVGSATNNQLVALGIQPTVDIPVIVRAFPK